MVTCHGFWLYAMIVGCMPLCSAASGCATCSLLLTTYLKTCTRTRGVIRCSGCMQAADRASQIATDAAADVSKRGPEEADKASKLVHEKAKEVST